MILAAVFSLATLAAPQQSSTDLERAEAHFVAGDLEAARAIAERAVNRDDRDFEALMLLGKIQLDWPVVGRFDAWRTFRRAASLRPDDPAPHFWQAVVGEVLGGADGERMIREGLLRVWERDPDYPGTWDLWNGVYRGPDQNLEAAAVLERHAGHPGADSRRVRMYIGAERFDLALELLGRMQAGGRDDALLWALRAEALFMSGSPDDGIDAYQRALELVDTDSLGYLWEQIAPIASPEEIAIHGGTDSPASRAAFYRAFWEKREPDLTTEVNERIAEHFERLRDARHNYRVRHPQARYHRSARWRTVAGSNFGRVVNATGQFLRAQDQPLEGRRQAGVADPEWDIGVAEPDSLSRYRRYGLDGRGLVLLRFGEPESRMISAGPTSGGDVESWTYRVGGETQVLTFARASGFDGFGGEMVFFPIDVTEAHNSELMLERDETSLQVNIEMDAWVAFFRAPSRRGAFIYVRSEPDGSAVRVWDAGWRPISSARGPGPLVLQGASGRNNIGIDYRLNAGFGRVREELIVPRFANGSLSVSSVLVARSDSAGLDRDEIARLMPADLSYPADSALSLYVEIYDLVPDADGVASYEVDYVFMPERQGTPVSFAFAKTVPAGQFVEERLVVMPGRVPPGQYRILFRVRDLIGGREVVQTRVDVVLH